MDTFKNANISKLIERIRIRCVLWYSIIVENSNDKTIKRTPTLCVVEEQIGSRVGALSNRYRTRSKFYLWKLQQARWHWKMNVILHARNMWYSILQHIGIVLDTLSRNPHSAAVTLISSHSTTNIMTNAPVKLLRRLYIIQSICIAWHRKNHCFEFLPSFLGGISGKN